MNRRRRDVVRAAEETVMAFRRTALQIGIVGLAAVRMLTEQFGWWVAVGAVAVTVMIAAVHRSVSTFVDTVDADGEVEWAPHGTGHAGIRHGAVASASTAVAVLALAWIISVA